MVKTENKSTYNLCTYLYDNFVNNWTFAKKFTFISKRYTYSGEIFVNNTNFFFHKNVRTI